MDCVAGPQFVPKRILVVDDNRDAADLGMPEMDGFAVASALRKARSLGQLVVIAYTAWGDPETRQRVRESGFDGHTVKPAKFDVLLNLVINTRRAS